MTMASHNLSSHPGEISYSYIEMLSDHFLSILSAL